MPYKKKKLFHISRNRNRCRKYEFNDYKKNTEDTYEVEAMLGDDTHWSSMTHIEQEIVIGKQLRDEYDYCMKKFKETYGCLGCNPFETHYNLWVDVGIKCNDISDFLSTSFQDDLSFYCDDCYEYLDFIPSRYYLY